MICADALTPIKMFDVEKVAEMEFICAFMRFPLNMLSFKC